MKMLTQTTMLKGLAWFWGTIALGGVAGAAAIQMSGPPAESAAPVIMQAATPGGSAPLPTTAPLPPLAAPASLPTLHAPAPARSRRVQLASARKSEAHTVRRAAGPASEPEARPETEARYWSYPTAQAALAQYPSGWATPRQQRYTYPPSAYYGYYSGY